MKKILHAIFAFCLLSSAACAALIPDVSRFAVGARTVGLGRAFVGIADDANSIFYNPAGGGWAKTVSLVSTTTRLLDDTNVLSLAGMFPTHYGSVGFAYATYGISGSFVTYRDALGQVAVDSTREGMSFSGSSAILSFSSLPFISPFSPDVKATLGFNVKLFRQSLGGGTVGAASSSGIDIDGGLLIRPSEWLRIGLSALNMLPDSYNQIGGTNNWDSGEQRKEGIENVIKTGIGLKIPSSMLPKGMGKELIIDADLDMFIAKSRPALLHIGTEWWPSDYLGLRMGFDQDVASAGQTDSMVVASSFTYGAGLKFSSFLFDYAFKPSSLTDANSHYFSISYLIPTFSERQVIVALEPRDRTITYKPSVLLKAKSPSKVREVRVGGAAIKTLAGSFETVVDLSLGKNPIKMEGYDEKGSNIASGECRVLRLAEFSDVPHQFWASDPISHMATLGIVSGFPDGTFRPQKGLTRAEMVTLLVRAKSLELSKPSGNVFKDVGRQHWASQYIKASVDSNIVKGYPDGKFKPSAGLTRAEAVSVLVRFGNVPDKDPASAAAYSDVPAKHWASKAISAAKQAGILSFIKESTFKPSRPVTRAEACEMLSRIRFISDRTDLLLNFDAGY